MQPPSSSTFPRAAGRWVMETRLRWRSRPSTSSTPGILAASAKPAGSFASLLVRSDDRTSRRRGWSDVDGAARHRRTNARLDSHRRSDGSAARPRARTAPTTDQRRPGRRRERQGATIRPVRMMTALLELGFVSSGISPDGIAHRFERAGVLIDVLAPDGLGGRTSLRTVGGATIPVAGGTYALAESHLVPVAHRGRSGRISRPVDRRGVGGDGWCGHDRPRTPRAGAPPPGIWRSCARWWMTRLPCEITSGLRTSAVYELSNSLRTRPTRRGASRVRDVMMATRRGWRSPTSGEQCGQWRRSDDPCGRSSRPSAAGSPR